MAKFALNTLKKTKVAILIDVRQDYSVGLAAAYKAYFTSHGGTIVAEQSYSSRRPGFQSAADLDQELEPGGDFCARLLQRSRPDRAPVARARHHRAADGRRWLGFADAHADRRSGDRRRLFLHPFLDRRHLADRAGFRERLSGAFQQGSRRDGRARLRRRRRSGSTRSSAPAAPTPQKLRDAIAATKNYDGVTGKITIDEQRNATKSAEVLTIKDGKFHFVETIAP